jgi:hypothetical protein
MADMAITALITKMYRNESSREIANPVHRKLNGMCATKRRTGICRYLKFSWNSTILIEMSWLENKSMKLSHHFWR